jgi:hypothetical protein
VSEIGNNENLIEIMKLVAAWGISDSGLRVTSDLVSEIGNNENLASEII